MVRCWASLGVELSLDTGLRVSWAGRQAMRIRMRMERREEGVSMGIGVEGLDL